MEQGAVKTKKSCKLDLVVSFDFHFISLLILLTRSKATKALIHRASN